MNEEPVKSRVNAGFKQLQRIGVVKQVIIAELQELMPKSQHYQKEYESAKTRTKKKLMMKRLKQNNTKVAELVMALQRLDGSSGEKPNVVSATETGGAETESATEESVDESIPKSGE